jgi:hypothetical protein
MKKKERRRRRRRKMPRKNPLRLDRDSNPRPHDYEPRLRLVKNPHHPLQQNPLNINIFKARTSRAMIHSGLRVYL